MLFRPLLFLLMSIATLPLQAREFYIDVSNKDLWDYPWSFEIDSVFDARPNPEIAGYVAVGIANRPRLALLKNLWISSFTAFLANRLLKVFHNLLRFASTIFIFMNGALLEGNTVTLS